MIYVLQLVALLFAVLVFWWVVADELEWAKNEARIRGTVLPRLMIRVVAVIVFGQVAGVAMGFALYNLLLAVFGLDPRL